MKITIEKTFQGSLRLSTIVDDDYFTQQYFFYSEREARAEFRAYVKRELAKVFISQNTIIKEVTP